MSVEQAEIVEFIQIWRHKPDNQRAPELASLSLETKRIPDPYYYDMDQDGDLVDPASNHKLKDVIRTDNAVGLLEAEAFDCISNWFRREASGVIAWISPPHPGIYPTSKVIISQIEHEGGRKRLFNRAIVLDMDERECLRFARNLTQFSTNKPFLTYSDQLRVTPLILGDSKSWVDIFERLIGQQDVWNMVREGRDKAAKYQAILQAQRVFSEPDIKEGVARMLGNAVASCPVLFTKSGNLQTAFEVFSANSLLVGKDRYGSLVFECEKCRGSNRRPWGKLISNCQHCGASTNC